MSKGLRPHVHHTRHPGGHPDGIRAVAPPPGVMAQQGPGSSHPGAIFRVRLIKKQREPLCSSTRGSPSSQTPQFGPHSGRARPLESLLGHSCHPGLCTP